MNNKIIIHNNTNDISNSKAVYLVCGHMDTDHYDNKDDFEHLAFKNDIFIISYKVNRNSITYKIKNS